MSETVAQQTSNGSTAAKVRGKPGRKPGTQVKRAGLGASAPSMAATGLGSVSSSAIGRNSPVLAAQFSALPAKGPWSVDEACDWLQITALAIKQAYGMPAPFIITPGKIAA